jgi:hypothetical protein
MSRRGKSSGKRSADWMTIIDRSFSVMSVRDSIALLRTHHRTLTRLIADGLIWEIWIGDRKMLLTTDVIDLLPHFRGDAAEIRRYWQSKGSWMDDLTAEQRREILNRSFITAAHSDQNKYAETWVKNTWLWDVKVPYAIPDAPRKWTDVAEDEEATSDEAPLVESDGVVRYDEQTKRCYREPRPATSTIVKRETGLIARKEFRRGRELPFRKRHEPIHLRRGDEA